MKYKEKIQHLGERYLATLWRNKIVIYKPIIKSRSWKLGRIKLPDGWQDMDRTWTAQDIYWVDKYDCPIVLG